MNQCVDTHIPIYKIEYISNHQSNTWLVCEQCIKLPEFSVEIFEFKTKITVEQKIIIL